MHNSPPHPRFSSVSLAGESDNRIGFPVPVHDQELDQPSPPDTSLSRHLGPIGSTHRKSRVSVRHQAHSPPGTTVRNTFIELDEASAGTLEEGSPQTVSIGLRGYARSSMSSYVRCGSEPPCDIPFSKLSTTSSSKSGRPRMSTSQTDASFSHQSGRPRMSTSQTDASFIRQFTSLVSTQGVDHRWEYFNTEGIEAPDGWQGRADASYDCPLNSNVDALAAVSGYAEWVSAQWSQNQPPECADGAIAGAPIGMPHAADSYSSHEWLTGALPQHGHQPNPHRDFGYTASELPWSEQQHPHEFPDSGASRPPGRFAPPSEDSLTEAMHRGFGAGVATGIFLRDGDFGPWPPPGGAPGVVSASGWGGPAPTNTQGRRSSRREDPRRSTASSSSWTQRDQRPAPAACEPYEFEAAPTPPGPTTAPGIDCEAASNATVGRSADCQVVWCDARAFKEASDAMRKELEQRTQSSVKAYKSAERCIRLLRKKQHAQGRPRCVFLISWSNAPALVPFLASVPHIVARVVLLVDTGRSCHHEAADHLARLFPCVAGVAQTWAEALEAVAAAVKDHQAREA